MSLCTHIFMGNMGLNVSLCPCLGSVKKSNNPGNISTFQHSNLGTSCFCRKERGRHHSKPREEPAAVSLFVSGLSLQGKEASGWATVGLATHAFPSAKREVKSP